MTLWQYAGFLAALALLSSTSSSSAVQIKSKLAGSRQPTGDEFSLHRRAAPAQLPLTFLSQPFNFYHMPLTIGTPPQILNMVVDTGSSDVVVAGSRCEFSGCPLTESQLYNFTQSSTMGNKSTESTTIPFGEGTATGFVVADTVTLGAFSVSGIEFLEAEEIIDGPPAGQVSGLIGLGGAARSHLTAVPFWETLILRNSLPQPEFSIWLARVGSAPPDRTSFPGGAFIFGGVNQSLYAGDIEFLDSGGAEAQFWTLNLTSLKSQNVPVDITGSSPIASIDTGIYGVLGPPAIVAALYAHVPGANSPGNDGFWQFPCNASVNVSVSFGGREWDITPADMNLGPVTPGSTICNGAILGQDVNFNGSTTQIRWVFGVPFLRGVYSVFKQNPAQIGFAQLSEAAGGPAFVAEPQTSATSTSTTSSASATTTPPPPPPHRVPVGAIAGAIIGSIILIALLSGLLLLLRRRRKRNLTVSESKPDIGRGGGDRESVFPDAYHAPKSPPTTEAAFSILKRDQAAAVRRHIEHQSAIRDVRVTTSRGVVLASSEDFTGTSANSTRAGLRIDTSGFKTYPVVQRELDSLREEVKRLEEVAADMEPPPTYVTARGIGGTRQW